MTNAVLLDNVTHKDLRVKVGHSAEFGDNVNMVLVFPTEFTFVQREYPILFRKDSTEGFQAVALLGFDKGENLFLGDADWNARYVPAVQQRGPFLIGIHQQAGGAEEMIHVDLDHPRISQAEGEPVFLKHGGNSPYLQHVNRMLQLILDGAEIAKPMFKTFEEMGLIESVELNVRLDEQVEYNLPDFFTVNTERLSALDGTSLERLNRAGYLKLAWMVAESLGNIDGLVQLKNRKRKALQI
ncbi:MULTISPECIES: SapC family protein [Microbulbifer]|uniref:SapC family protein n=1 Tax=Microbulbifer celer TaxID=435905 RepID=A0ABW3UBN8_9GAMM|nr:MULTISPECIES: SapC family protein [Microbulbifer]UFN56397.1 SapC family protein [Microbulbifer celer]